MKDIIVLTKELLRKTDYLLNVYHKVKEINQRDDFYEVIRPFANEMKEEIDVWKTLATEWVMEKKPLYLNQLQIKSTSEHLEIISIQAFYPETSKTRFFNYVKSIQYVLTSLMEHLTKQTN